MLHIIGFGKLPEFDLHLHPKLDWRHVSKFFPQSQQIVDELVTAVELACSCTYQKFSICSHTGRERVIRTHLSSLSMLHE